MECFAPFFLFSLICGWVSKKLCNLLIKNATKGELLKMTSCSFLTLLLKYLLVSLSASLIFLNKASAIKRSACGSVTNALALPAYTLRDISSACSSIKLISCSNCSNGLSFIVSPHKNILLQ